MILKLFFDLLQYLLNPGVISIAFSPHFPKKGIEEGNAKKDSENQLSIFCFSHINTKRMHTSLYTLSRKQNLNRTKKGDVILNCIAIDYNYNTY